MLTPEREAYIRHLKEQVTDHQVPTAWADALADAVEDLLEAYDEMRKERNSLLAILKDKKATEQATLAAIERGIFTIADPHKARQDFDDAQRRALP